MSSWYAQNDGRAVGPLDLEGLRRLAAGGQLTAATPICRVGAAAWGRADADPEVAGLFAQAMQVNVPSVGWDVFRVAKYHRIFLYMLLANIVVSGLSLALASRIGIAGQLGLGGLLLVVGAAMIVINILMQVALRTHVVLIVLGSILLLAPCIGLITMLVISQSVQKRFAALGLSVGFMGITRDKLIAAGFVPQPI